MTLAFITHPECLLHEMGPTHPESPARLLAIKQALMREHLFDTFTVHEAPLVTQEQLLRAHDADYINFIFQSAPENGYFILDPDTLMNPHSLTAALHAAGAAVLAVDLVMAQTVKTAFCHVRPPGHHAEKDKAMGFCFFNNIAVGALHAVAKYGLNRIAIVDFDVHHGNGTENILINHPNILLCSSFQHPFYPYTHIDIQNDHLLKMPLPAGANSADFQHVIKTLCLPKLIHFKPELVFFSAGFDAHAADPLANLMLTTEDYAWVTHEVKKATQAHTQGRMISCLEGGYNLTALGDSAVAHIKAMM